MEQGYLYPDNLKAKATLWLWELKDLCIAGAGGIIGATALSKLGTFLPLVIAAVYTFLTIRFEDTSVLDFIRYAFCFFLGKQQEFYWRQGE